MRPAPTTQPAPLVRALPACPLHAEHTLPWLVPLTTSYLVTKEPPPGARSQRPGPRLPWELALARPPPPRQLHGAWALAPALSHGGRRQAAGGRQSRKGVWVHVHRKRSGEHTLGESHCPASPMALGPGAQETLTRQVMGCRRTTGDRPPQESTTTTTVLTPAQPWPGAAGPGPGQAGSRASRC